MRAAIYARYSTENQNEKSTEDQIALCRQYAAHEGYEVVATYHDKAKSGASMFGRDGLYSMMKAAEERVFDVLIVEALDRLARDMEDLAGLHKRFNFFGIKIRAINEGPINTLIVGLRGLIGQMYREDNAHKVRRGLQALVARGLSAGGRSYGYAVDPANKGKFFINEQEAEIVRRIYREYRDGKSPRSIAYDLNAEGIKPPRSMKWNASTLNGNPQRVTGILHNPLYKGQIVWNKLTFIKDPSTGRRVSRPNPQSEWQYKDVPELRIVDDELWDAVQEAKAKLSRKHAHHARRPKRLLSGIVRCGACGSTMVAGGKDKSGGYRYRCSSAAESNTCPAPTSFYINKVEKLVLDTLHEELSNPKGLELFVQEYITERKRLMHEKIVRRSSIERKLTQASREFERILDHLQQGTVQGADVKDRLSELREAKQMLQQELETAPEPPKEVALHPRAVMGFRHHVSKLQKMLDDGITSAVSEEAQFLRNIIRDVLVWRDPETGGMKLKIAGELNDLVEFSASTKVVSDKAGCGGRI